jgi:hypothetical protein
MVRLSSSGGTHTRSALMGPVAVRVRAVIRAAHLEARQGPPGQVVLDDELEEQEQDRQGRDPARPRASGAPRPVSSPALGGVLTRRSVQARRTRMCNFLEYKDSKVVYRRYASLFFVTGIGQDDNELITLEIIHRSVPSGHPVHCFPADVVHACTATSKCSTDTLATSASLTCAPPV